MTFYQWKPVNEQFVYNCTVIFTLSVSNLCKKWTSKHEDFVSINEYSLASLFLFVASVEFQGVHLCVHKMSEAEGKAFMEKVGNRESHLIGPTLRF